MKEVYIVKIEYYLQELFSEKLEKYDVKIFAEEKGAEKFLVENKFVYGCPYPFRQTGWYYSEIINTDMQFIDRFVFARVEKAIIDDDSYYRDKLNDYVLRRKK